MHECIIESDDDQFAETGIHYVRCRCHMESWHAWKPGDAPIKCMAGTIVTPEEGK